MTVDIHDDFLSDYHFKQIQNELIGDGFPWFYNNYTVDLGDKKSMFTHTFFSIDPPWNGNQSAFFPLWENCLHKLRCNQLFRIKSNLHLRTIFHRKCGYHIDYKDIKTAILYMNTNNGWTNFKKGGKVKSVANRMVIFDSNLEHAGVTCTDEDSRVVVNFNYV